MTNVIQGLLAPGGDELTSSNPRTRLVAVETAKAAILPLILEQMDVATAANLPRATFEARHDGWVKELLPANRILARADEVIN